MTMRTAVRCRVIIAAGALALAGASCSSDDDEPAVTDSPPATVSEVVPSETSVPDISFTDVTVAPEGDAGTGTTPAGLSEDCAGYYRLFTAAASGDMSVIGDLDEAIEDLQDRVPEDLREDVEIVGDAIGRLADLAERYEGNPTGLFSDPDAIEIFSDPAFGQSSQRVNTWLQTECAAG